MQTSTQVLTQISTQTPSSFKLWALKLRQNRFKLAFLASILAVAGMCTIFNQVNSALSR
jgi:hypothetical protein